MTSPRTERCMSVTSSGPLVDEQHDEVHLGVVRGDAVGDVLQQHRLAGARRRDDQAALALADRRHQVEDAGRQVVAVGLERDALLRVERRQVLEEDLLARPLGRLEVDRLDLDQREVALAFLRRADLAADGVARVQVELADLRRRDVDVVGTGEVVVVGRAQEAEAVRQHLEHALGEEHAALLGPAAQDLEDQILLAQPGGAGDVEVLGHLRELLHAHFLERGQVHDLGVGLAHAGLDHLDVLLGRGPMARRVRLRVPVLVAAVLATLAARPLVCRAGDLPAGAPVTGGAAAGAVVRRWAGGAGCEA